MLDAGSTVSIHFHSVLDALCKLVPMHIKINEGLAPEIGLNPKFFPYFKDAIGALDGSHIPIYVPAKTAGRYRNRKGFHFSKCTWRLQL